MSSNMDGKDFLMGAVVGGLLGAMAALLLAPKSGRDLRKDISDQYGTISEKTQQIASTVSEKTANIAKTATTHTTEWVDKAKEVAGTVIDEVKTWSEKRKQTEESTVPTDYVVESESNQEAK
jgi:gas vesicle protein